MLRTTLLLIIVSLLGGCSLEGWIASQFAPIIPTPTPAAKILVSNTRRYTAELTSLATPFNFAFSGFTILDTQTQYTSQQNFAGVASGVSFDWTANDHYLLITTDIIASSHGCDEMLVFTGDGSRLVFDTSSTTSICRSIETDASIEIIASCPNDDILYYQSGTFRLTPSTGTYTTFPSFADAQC